MAYELDIDPERVRIFGDLLSESSSKRVGNMALWDAFERAFPDLMGVERVRYFLGAVESLEKQGRITLPVPKKGKRWGTEFGLRIPREITLSRSDPTPPDRSWKNFPWHPSLSWVPDLKQLGKDYIPFLKKVHEGLVNGWFIDKVPLKYRSLQLTGDEKRLKELMDRKLFGPGRLSPGLLGFVEVDQLFIWESISDTPRAIVFENFEPYMIALDVLAQMADSPYGIIICGWGNKISKSIARLKEEEFDLELIDYVGDLDIPGMQTAIRARDKARELKLAPLAPASRIYHHMLDAAGRLGRPNGWPADNAVPLTHRFLADLKSFLPADLIPVIITLFESENRIPEEVLHAGVLREAFTRLRDEKRRPDQDPA